MIFVKSVADDLLTVQDIDYLVDLLRQGVTYHYDVVVLTHLLEEVLGIGTEYEVF